MSLVTGGREGGRVDVFLCMIDTAVHCAVTEQPPTVYTQPEPEFTDQKLQTNFGKLPTNQGQARTVMVWCLQASLAEDADQPRVLPQVPGTRQRLRPQLRLLLRQGGRELPVRHVSALHLLQAQGEAVYSIYSRALLTSCRKKKELNVKFSG